MKGEETMRLIDEKVSDYLDLVASDAPAPGGGSASALCGSQGIGLVAMVAKLTAGKEKFAEYHDICKEIYKEADELCGKLAAQVDLDTEAYGKISDAFKLPKGTDEEKAARKETINEATRYASEVPLRTMELGVQGLRLAKKILGHYNTNCASDIGCAAFELLSCVMGAWYNVLINTSGTDFGEEMQSDGKKLLEEAEKLASDVGESVEKDIAG